MRPGDRATATLDRRRVPSVHLVPATRRADRETATPAIHEIHERLVRIGKAPTGRRDATDRDPDQIDRHGQGTAHLLH
jgi:hypothetical protein